MPVAVLPYTVKTTSAGVGFSYSAALRTVTSTRIQVFDDSSSLMSLVTPLLIPPPSIIQDTYREDVLVSAAEEYGNHKLLRYDNISVSIGFNYLGAGTLITYLVS